jgi:hypothetical protein
MTERPVPKPRLRVIADSGDLASASPTTGAPWRGRRRVADPKDKFVAVRCTSAQHAAWTAAAAQIGTNVGDYLRTLADGSPSPRAVRRPPVEKEALARVLGELGKVGSNVNQLARIANTSGDMPELGTLTGIAADVREIRATLMRALGRGD